jgi:outer membrane lipoprotein SlyB
MGEDVDWFVIGAVGAVVIGAIIVGAIFGGVWGSIGAGIGAVVVGAIVGSLFSDPIEREVNYHPREWERVQLFFDVQDVP